MQLAIHVTVSCLVSGEAAWLPALKVCRGGRARLLAGAGSRWQAALSYRQICGAGARHSAVK